MASCAPLIGFSCQQRNPTKAAHIHNYCCPLRECKSPALTLTSSFAVSVNDATGSGAGWNLQAVIGVLADAASDTIPAGNHTIQSTAVSGTTGTAPTNGIGYPLMIPTTSGKIFDAATNTGTGQATMTFTTHLVAPADAAVGTYTATLTITITAGP